MENISEAQERNSSAGAFEQQLIEHVCSTRMNSNLSQSELARKSGVPQKTISRMENGLSVPSIKTIYKLVEAMGYTLTFDIRK